MTSSQSLVHLPLFYSYVFVELLLAVDSGSSTIALANFTEDHAVFSGISKLETFREFVSISQVPLMTAIHKSIFSQSGRHCSLYYSYLIIL